MPLKDIHVADLYWLLWSVFSFVTFIVPEAWSLATHNPQGTLSDAIWRMEKYDPADGLTAWTALHFLFVGMLIVIFAWLIAHFGWRLFR